MMPVIKSLIDGTEWFGRRLGEVTSWLILGTLISVLTAVIAGALGANEILNWGIDLPLLGSALTINGVFDLEWHFFAIMVMAGGTYAYLDDQHVRSDLIYSGLSPKGKKHHRYYRRYVFAAAFRRCHDMAVRAFCDALLYFCGAIRLWRFG